MPWLRRSLPGLCPKPPVAALRERPVIAHRGPSVWFFWDLHGHSTIDAVPAHRVFFSCPRGTFLPMLRIMQRERWWRGDAAEGGAIGPRGRWGLG
jgi:hypothetical protein